MKNNAADHWDKNPGISSGIAYFAEHCLACGVCLKDCRLLKDLGLAPKTLAELFIAEADGGLPAYLINAIQECSLCGHCSSHCPVGLNPGDFMVAARGVLMSSGRAHADQYCGMLVDQDNHFFKLYRETWQIDYRDMQKERCSTLFWPGCSLSSYAPELTRAVYQWLSEQEDLVGLSVECCGQPLAGIGLVERSRRHIETIAGQLRKTGVRQLVTACPNCFYHLQECFSDIGIISLYDLLAETGIKLPSGSKLTVHDSCPDRYTGQIGTALRTLASENNNLQELSHYGRLTICCGAGGIVSLVAPELSDRRASQRWAEIAEVDVDYCISACMGCVKRLRGTAPGIEQENRMIHVLELVFDVKVDYARLQRQLASMWEGELGEKNSRLLFNGSADE